MTITSTSIGPRTVQFDYTTGTTLAQIMAAVDAAITTAGTGWTVYDAAASATAKCYAGLNKDGLSSKYVTVDYASNQILAKTYESWNSTTHVGTNLCYNSDNATYGGAYSTTAPGQIFLFISPRWLAFCTRNSATGMLNNNAAWQGVFGCFEVARDNPEDTAALGYPPYFFTNTNMMFSNPSVSACGTSPRTRNASTGANALIEISTILGKTRSAANIKLGNFMPTNPNVWNGKDWALTLYAHEPNYVIRGRVYGLKAFTQAKNLFMDKSTCPVDADFFYQANGTVTDHYLVINGTYNASPAGRILIPA